MNTGENITNAYKVIIKTYQNIEKFFSDLDEIARENGYVSISPKYLRWKSDNDVNGWIINSLIKLYQLEDDKFIEDKSGLRDGHIFCVDVTISEDSFAAPTLTISQFRYEEDALLSWRKLPSVSEHWGFFYPTRNKDYMGIQQKEGYMKSIPLTNKAKEVYWDLEEVLFRRLELVSVNSKEKILEDVIGSFEFFRTK